MNDSDVKRFRARLLEELAALDHEDDLGAEAQKVVTLDQQSVGRLSRMDALQGQAMAKATQARREAHRMRIHAAFARMDEDEFGYCTDCGENIAPRRLELDPTVPTCISCAQG
ncbi:TraR/DksA C4-type zinc finger protein [Aliiroseovarius sp.]|uniref:TraR/DksA family transcriptional regulator n=1 Tax=Aliiroseovarius sp. TaxID=1872442 RepID=UPI002606D378|nr:TraR/DksA C4-type zinc finger protein [Aliiroseovarius sp.]